jgi:hypothetical protein
MMKRPYSNTTSNASSDGHQHHRRMAVFAGPHKSASSSVQELFMKYAGNGPEGKLVKHPSLQKWTWPWNPRRRSYLPRKGFAPLVTEEIGFHRLIWDTILQVWNTTSTGDDGNNFVSPNIIWGTEELDRFGTTPWSGRNGLQAIYQVWNLTRPSSLDIVVNYRRPRKDQWISIWKQLIRKAEGVSYSGFLCDPDEYLRIWEYLDCVANPLGLVQALLDFWDAQRRMMDTTTTRTGTVTIHLLDMQGVAAMKGDVGHVLACDVLGVECTADHWLPNVERPILQNAKSGNPGLSTEQMEEIEWILQQRDCSYRQRFLEATSTTSGSITNDKSTPTRLALHYADNIWDVCPSSSSSRFSNTTFLLDLLQSQVGCGTFKKTTISTLRQQARTQVATIALQPQAVNGSTAEKGLPDILRQKPPSSSSSSSVELLQRSPKKKTIDDSNTHLVQTAKAQLLVMYVLLVLMIGILVRRLKCRGYVPHQRRLAGRHRIMAAARSSSNGTGT